MPVFRDLTPMLHTPDLPGTIAFWTEVLGFTLNNTWTENPAAPLTWADLIRDQTAVMFMTNAHYDAPQATGTLYFNVAGVEEYWTQLKDHPRITVAWELQTMEYGMREFAVQDNNGYLLSFGEPISRPQEH